PNYALLFFSAHRLPQLDLVAIGIHDPGELAVLVGVGSLHDLDAVLLELREQRRQVVDPVVDHEAGGAGAEPLRLALGDVPDGEPAILGVIVGPPQDRATPVLERQAQIVSIPGSETLVIRRRLEEHATDPSHTGHRCLPVLWQRLYACEVLLST